MRRFRRVLSRAAAGPRVVAVCGPAFEIAVDVRVAADVAAGSLSIPARLRYQACDATTCFAPTRAEASWTLIVGERYPSPHDAGPAL